MGLMDVLNGMQNGPRGPSAGTKGGMSPITMAVIGLLAYKALKQFTGAPKTSPATPGSSPSLLRREVRRRIPAVVSAVSSPAVWAVCSPAARREAY